jgi:hypothetical protein
LNIFDLPGSSSRFALIIWISAQQAHPIIGWVTPCLLHPKRVGLCT